MVSKGHSTRERILDTAFRLAAREGLEGMSLATLADELKMSKSGLFAHFRSKEQLQLEMLSVASRRFVENVLEPSFRERRGLPRLRALFENWRKWAMDPRLPGGCIFVAASAELDDREGPVRAYVVEQQKELQQTIERAIRLCIDAGDFRSDVDVEQLAFELLGMYLSFHQAHRLLHDPRAEFRARRAFNRLVSSAVKV
jgi:AcrR family transcriptional regulator